MPVVYVDDREIKAVKYRDGSFLIIKDSNDYLQGEVYSCAREFFDCLKQDQQAEKEFRMER